LNAVFRQTVDKVEMEVT
jgi:hypothetical protein